MSSKRCHVCGLVNFAEAEACKRCGEKLLTERQLAFREQAAKREPSPAEPVAPPAEVAGPKVDNTKLILGAAGSLTLVLGVFSPLLSIPIIGSVNYFRNGEGDGVIVLVLAVLALLLTLGRYHRAAGLAGVACLLVTCYSFFTVKTRLVEAKANFDSGSEAGNRLGRALMETVSMEWGWAVLLVGAVLLIVSSELPGERVQKGPAGGKEM